jgi:NTP pyrophosphatase (non-canonical NTP hydrolase)
MIDNKLRDYVYQVIHEKGFHTMPFTQLQCLTFRQLNHLFIEADEACRARDDKYIEELADIAIVLLDLLGIQGIEVPVWFPVKESRTDDLFAHIAQMAQTYRKKGHIRGADKIFAVLDFLCAERDISLETAIRDKMAKNEQRPQRYGVA